MTATETPQPGSDRITPLQGMALSALKSQVQNPEKLQKVPPKLLNGYISFWLSRRRRQLIEIGNIARHLKNMLGRDDNLVRIRVYLDQEVGKLSATTRRIIRESPELNTLFNAHSSLSDEEFKKQIHEFAIILPQS